MSKVARGSRDPLNRFADLIDLGADLVAGLLAATVLAVMLAQVFFRYVLNDSLQWSEELAVWGLVWMVFIGAIGLLRHWRHISIFTFVRMLPSRLRAYPLLLSKVLALLFLLTLTYYGIEVFGGTFHATSPSIGISTRWVKLAIPVGAFFMALLAVLSIVSDSIRLYRGEAESLDIVDRDFE